MKLTTEGFSPAGVKLWLGARCTTSDVPWRLATATPNCINGRTPAPRIWTNQSHYLRPVGVIGPGWRRTPRRGFQMTGGAPLRGPLNQPSLKTEVLEAGPK
jgi:hypothetical protein